MRTINFEVNLSEGTIARIFEKEIEFHPLGEAEASYTLTHDEFNALIPEVDKFRNMMRILQDDEEEELEDEKAMVRDVTGAQFNPVFHATKHGQPAYNKDNTFRRRRKDRGQAHKKVTPSEPPPWMPSITEAPVGNEDPEETDLSKIPASLDRRREG